MKSLSKFAAIRLMTLSAVFALAFGSVADAQSDANVLLLAKVTDHTTRTPVVVEYKILNEKGENVVKGKTSEKEGLIKVVVPQDQVYTLKFSGYNILASQDTVHLPKGESYYYETERDLHVKLVQKGMELQAANVFEAGSARISAAGKRVLEEMTELVKFNRALYVLASIGSDGAAGSVQQQRIEAVKQFVTAKGRLVSRRVTVQAAAGSQKHSFVLTVKKVQDLFR